MTTINIDSTQIIKFIQSPTVCLLNQLETCKSAFPKEPTKVPLFFSLPHEEINTIILYIKDKQNDTTDFTKYIEIAKSLENDLAVIEKDNQEIFTKSCYEKASTELNKKISDVLKNVKKLNDTIGPIEIEKKVEVVQEEEEEVAHEDENIVEEKVEIDTFQTVLEIYESIDSKEYENISEKVDLLRDNIDRYEDLEPLRQVLEGARSSLDSNQHDKLSNIKKPLLAFLNKKITWQSTTIPSASSPSSIVNLLIDIQRQANDIANEYIDSPDRRPELFRKMAKAASDAQALVVQSFKFYKKRSSHLKFS